MLIWLIEQTWLVNIARISLPSTPFHASSGDITLLLWRHVLFPHSSHVVRVGAANQMLCVLYTRSADHSSSPPQPRQLARGMGTQAKSGQTGPFHGVLKYSSRGRRSKELSFPLRWRSCDVTESSQQAPTLKYRKYSFRGFPGCAVVENLPANAGDTGSSPGTGRSHMPWSN